MTLSSLQPLITLSQPEDEFQHQIKHEFIIESAIAIALFDVAIEFIEDTGLYEPNRLLNHTVATQWKVHKPHSFGALAAFKNEDHCLWQAKPKFPREDLKKQKPRKYETPIGHGARAFTPAISVKIWVEIAKRYHLTHALPSWVKAAVASKHFNLPSQPAKGFGVELPEECRTEAVSNEHSKHSLQQSIEVVSFWEWVEQIPEIPIVITEGGKKSLCLLSQGYVAIALYGVNGGYSVNERIGGEMVRKLQPDLIPDLSRFTIPGRQFILAFDQDENFETRQKVSSAIVKFSKLLISMNCAVSIAAWNGHEGKGIDDLIATQGVQAWEQALIQARPFAQWSIAYQLSYEVRRKPDLNIGDREFIEVISDLPKTGMIAFYGGKGSGKSKAIAQWLKSQSWMSITHLSSLGRDQASGWGGVFINDGDRHGSMLLKNGMPVNGGTVCIPSLLKVSPVKADILVLDEVSATLEFLLGSKLANQNGIRPLLLKEFCDRVRSAKLILIADADLTEEVLEFIESIRGERAYLVQSERRSLTYDATLIEGSRNCAIALLQTHIQQMPRGKLIYINTDSKAFAKTLTELLGCSQTLLVTGNTSSGDIEAQFLANKGQDLPSLVLCGLRFIVSSPSITQGFSIEAHTHLIDSVWGFYFGCSISVHSMAQALDRVRDSRVPRFCWAAKKGSALSRLSRSQTIERFLKDFRQVNTATARLVIQSLTPDIAMVTDAIDWQNQNLQMLAAIEVRRNRGMGALKETLMALLQKEGKHLSIVTPECSESVIQAANSAINHASDSVNRKYSQAVAAAESLSNETAKRLLEQAEPLSPDQVLSLEKFYLAEFYRLGSVQVEEVLFDRNGRTRSQIRRLESLLLPQLATETTAKTIAQNPEHPQDWNPIALEVWLLEQSGAAALIRDIAQGTIKTLPSHRIQAIAKFIRTHEVEFKLIFHFKSITMCSDQQIVGEILARHGIQTRRRGNRNNRRYEIELSQLRTLLEIIRRRQVSIAPPEVIEVNQGGAIGDARMSRLERIDIQPDSYHYLKLEKRTIIKQKQLLASSQQAEPL